MYWAVQRVDEEDGSITYEVWDHDPSTYRRVTKLNDSGDEEHMNAKRDADLIVKAVNSFLHPANADAAA